MVIPSLARRMWRGTDPRLLWKFGYNFGFKGMRSVQRFKRRLRQGKVFPPFLYISIINSCNLRCTGCWVDVAAPRAMISLEEMNRLIDNAKRHGNSFFGILGGEPFMHPDLLEILEAHPDCYFQIFTNGQFLTDEVAAELRRIGNATPLISIEGTGVISDQRRGRTGVLDKTLRGLDAAVRNRLITGVATSVCQTNFDELVSERWLDELIDRGVLYCWFHTYRAVGPDAAPELALTPEQVVAVRRFAVEMRTRKPIGIVDAYWNDKGQALCPAATGISHHISPWGDIEPCPIIQFANETIRDNDGDLFKTATESPLLEDFRRTAAGATRGCIVLERPDLLRDLVGRHVARDTTARASAMAELERMRPLGSQHNPDCEIPEKQWLYRFAKKHWYFGFGAYT
ncbi:MAG TPA: radical SAM protein [Thermoanaerobaculia bacterium]|nr:radical SAM protein [Thermoanaerobaculia bacterium]